MQETQIPLIPNQPPSPTISESSPPREIVVTQAQAIQDARQALAEGSLPTTRPGLNLAALQIMQPFVNVIVNSSPVLKAAVNSTTDQKAAPDHSNCGTGCPVPPASCPILNVFANRVEAMQMINKDPQLAALDPKEKEKHIQAKMEELKESRKNPSPPDHTVPDKDHTPTSSVEKTPSSPQAMQEVKAHPSPVVENPKPDIQPATKKAENASPQPPSKNIPTKSADPVAPSHDKQSSPSLPPFQQPIPTGAAPPPPATPELASAESSAPAQIIHKTPSSTRPTPSHTSEHSRTQNVANKAEKDEPTPSSSAPRDSRSDVHVPISPIEPTIHTSTADFPSEVKVISSVSPREPQEGQNNKTVRQPVTAEAQPVRAPSLSQTEMNPSPQAKTPLPDIKGSYHNLEMSTASPTALPPARPTPQTEVNVIPPTPRQELRGTNTRRTIQQPVAGETDKTVISTPQANDIDLDIPKNPVTARPDTIAPPAAPAKESTTISQPESTSVSEGEVIRSLSEPTINTQKPPLPPEDFAIDETRDPEVHARAENQLPPSAKVKVDEENVPASKKPIIHESLPPKDLSEKEISGSDAAEEVSETKEGRDLTPQAQAEKGGKRRKIDENEKPESNRGDRSTSGERSGKLVTKRTQTIFRRTPHPDRSGRPEHPPTSKRSRKNHSERKIHVDLKKTVRRRGEPHSKRKDTGGKEVRRTHRIISKSSEYPAKKTKINRPLRSINIFDLNLQRSGQKNRLSKKNSLLAPKKNRTVDNLRNTSQSEKQTVKKTKSKSTRRRRYARLRRFSARETGRVRVELPKKDRLRTSRRVATQEPSVRRSISLHPRRGRTRIQNEPTRKSRLRRFAQIQEDHKGKDGIRRIRTLSRNIDRQSTRKGERSVSTRKNEVNRSPADKKRTEQQIFSFPLKNTIFKFDFTPEKRQMTPDFDTSPSHRAKRMGSHRKRLPLRPTNKPDTHFFKPTRTPVESPRVKKSARQELFFNSGMKVENSKEFIHALEILRSLMIVLRMLKKQKVRVPIKEVIEEVQVAKEEYQVRPKASQVTQTFHPFIPAILGLLNTLAA